MNPTAVNPSLPMPEPHRPYCKLLRIALRVLAAALLIGLLLGALLGCREESQWSQENQEREAKKHLGEPIPDFLPLNSGGTQLGGTD